MSVWDDPDLRVNSDFVKFDEVGDTVTGTIINVRAHRFDDGSVAPQLLLDTADGEKTLTAGQVRLKAALAEKRPEAGDVITITLDGVEKRAGGKTLKLFSVTVGAPKPAAKAAKGDGGAKYTAEQIKAAKELGIDLPAY